MPTSPAALLLLADGRFPSGGYAHSGGVEPSIMAGRVHDISSLEAFLRGRAATSGVVAAAFAAAACGTADPGRLHALGLELDARLPSPAVRAVSRALGRQLARAAARVRPHSRLAELDDDAHQPIVLGVAASVFDLSPRDAALWALHENVVGPATAAVRLLSLDPFHVHAILANLTGLLDELADHATRYVDAPVAELPAANAPLLDIAAEHHAREAVRLFAS
ncbi:urease accessory protein UreF [Mycobacterium kyorinense]|uniref:Urease accessory protein UreF n=1 Tax=Mycobacterium kyorinense TaxID=487514 RepID=A0A1A2ZRP1_9MYCO|nr:urease accessory UreF family protein [Mycobacterium kyorinense]OBI51731.1 urease accessory protein UreF [Mycobacterium kyorinense]